ncbi:MAG TPA: nitrile hydratase subunit beta [Paraburkholderia sp.]|uniref:nitrile hydratase subunit beta n=1 Tax=Paraburkholderia sp. TaxID=1926495 RepID=UPI002C0D6009|nr:nitrile hydratase subunit beta [Paraburkholderia sp.]HTR08819.1 nitrile hydratase subunit beta [Paraburkholderia sp.]
MKLQHYLGGLENLGPVNLDARVFAQPWEQRIFGIHTVMMSESAHLDNALPGYTVKSLPTAFRSNWTWASLRTGAEAMQPFEYFKYRYYEKWLGGISRFFIDAGYLTEEELADKTAFYRNQPEAPLPDRPNAALDAQIDAYLQQGDSPRHASERAARFKAGQRVRIADPEAVDHTRLPGYLRSKTGTVDLVYPDTYAYFVSTGVDGIGDAMPVYRVAFDAAAIWGPDKSEPNTTIYADLFEAYVAAID